MLRLVSTVVLTRLLAPDVYGVFAVVLVYMYILEMFSDVGLRSLVFTKEEPVDDAFLHTCWTIAIARGFVILLFSVGLGYSISILQQSGTFPNSSAYAAPELPWALAALGIVSFVKGFQSLNLFMTERQMQFGRVTLMRISANFISLIVTITLAVYLRSIWALVLGALVRSLIDVVFSFLLFSGPSMKLRADLASLRLAYGRGKWILTHSILTALAHSADRLALGFFMSSATFGSYAIARQIIELFTKFVASMHSQMALQVFTKVLADEVSVFRQKYYRYRLVFDSISGLCAGGLLVLAPMIVTIIFDERYKSVAPLMQMLCLGLVVIGPLILRDAFSAQRKFKDMTILSIASTATIWLGLGVSLLIFSSIPAAVICIALYRLPEAIMLWVKGYRLGWITPARETLPIIFLLAGMASGWAVLEVWEYFQ